MESGIMQEGLIRTLPASDVLDNQEKTLDDIPVRYRDRLAAMVEDSFRDARNYRRSSGIDARIELGRLTRDGEYTEAKKAALRSAGLSTEFARVTANKGRLIMAWLEDIYADPAERPWQFRPPEYIPVPEQYKQLMAEAATQFMSTLSQAGVPATSELLRRFMDDQEEHVKRELRKQAKEEIDNIRRRVDAEVRDGGYYKAITEFLHDFVFFPAAFLKAPIPKYVDREVLFDNELSSTQDVVFSVERVDPHNIYPSPDCVDVKDGYIVEVTRMSYQDLLDLRYANDADHDAVTETLRKARNGELEKWLDSIDDTALPEQKLLVSPVHEVTPTTSFDALEYHGPVFGEVLREWGMTGVDDEEVYEVEALVVDGRALRAVINDDPLGRRPYFKASYELVAGSFWGQSLVDVLSDVQNVANATIRAMVNNIGIASGPQVVVNVDNLPDGDSLESLSPWKIWQVSNAYGQASTNTIQFYQPSSNVGDLLAVFNRMYELADELSMTPRIIQGEAGTLGRTASGISMVLNSASKGLKRLVYTIDNNVVAPMIKRFFHALLQYGDIEPPVFGVDLRVTGASGLLHEDSLQVRRNEFLQITANPIDTQILGVEGRAVILKEIAKSLGVDTKELFAGFDANKRALEAQQNGQGNPQQNNPQQNNIQIGSGQQLDTGQEVMDNFAPIPANG